jgi:Secretion system C-terminal sorting domain/FG-GAP-like repeat
MKPIIFFLAFFLHISLMNAQIWGRFPIEIVQNGRSLPNGVAGGLNNPQFSEGDFNQDGVLDLLVFDRSGNVPLVYINQGKTNETNYRFAPEYAANMPRLTNWALLRDYNGDNIPDLFSQDAGTGTLSAIPAISVYQGYYELKALKFKKIKFWQDKYNVLYYKTTNGYTNIYVSRSDLPSIDDIDGDGDLDIVTFDPGGSYAEWYQNESIERGYKRDSLIFTKADDCWGKFYESQLSKDVLLSKSNTKCANTFTGGGEPQLFRARHAGSTVTTFDIDGDNDKDLIAGDISFESLSMLTNGGSPQSAYMVAQDTAYPSRNIPVRIPIFPAAFMVDVNNDGKKDMIASPNSLSVPEDYNCSWLYLNTSATQKGITPTFQYKDFLVKDMIDVGSGAHPTFVDVDADGLLDMIIGNDTYFLPSGSNSGQLFYYRNTGTKTKPRFELINSDWLEFKAQKRGAVSLAPTFGDLDNDGDLDLLVGDIEGELWYAENTGGAGKLMKFLKIEAAYKGIDIGRVSRPQIADLNKDGLADIIIGEWQGNINYFQNKGTSNKANFDALPTIEFLGKIDTRQYPYTTGYAAPFLVEINKKYELWVGNILGTMRRIVVNQDNLSGTFQELAGDHNNVYEGEQAHPALADLDGNGIFELIVGNFRGGISSFRTDVLTGKSTPIKDETLAFDCTLAPVPAEKNVTLTFNNLPSKPTFISIYDISGRKVLQDIKIETNAQNIDIQQLVAGIYFVNVVVGENNVVKKLIVR